MKISPILIWVLLVIACRASASDLPYKTSSCFTGNYASFEAFISSRAKSDSSGAGEAQAARLEAAYERWRHIDQERVECRFFSYLVSDLPVTGFFIKPRNVNEADLLPVIFNRGGNADGAFQTPYLFDKLARIFHQKRTARP